MSRGTNGAFNLIRQDCQMLGQLSEQFSLLGFSCQITNQGALGSIRAQLFQLSLHVFHGDRFRSRSKVKTVEQTMASSIRNVVRKA